MADSPDREKLLKNAHQLFKAAVSENPKEDISGAKENLKNLEKYVCSVGL